MEQCQGEESMQIYKTDVSSGMTLSLGMTANSCCAWNVLLPN